MCVCLCGCAACIKAGCVQLTFAPTKACSTSSPLLPPSPPFLAPYSTISSPLYPPTQARPIAFAATARDAGALPPSLRQAGCLDLELRLPAPGASGRAAMLLRGLAERGCTLATSPPRITNLDTESGAGFGGDFGGHSGGGAVASPADLPRGGFAGAGAGASGWEGRVEGRGQEEEAWDALTRIADKADGFDAKDLQLLLDRALHVALRRRLAAGGGTRAGAAVDTAAGPTAVAGACAAAGAQASSAAGSAARAADVGPDGAGLQQQMVKQQQDHQHHHQQQQQRWQQEEGQEAVVQQGVPASSSIPVSIADLEAAFEGFVPAAFRGVGRAGRKGGAPGQGVVEGWQDVGGLREARAALVEALELPIKWVG